MLSGHCTQQITSKDCGINIEILTAMCLPVLSLGILSWHKPSQWQLQVLESWRKIRESKKVISSEVVGDLPVMLDSCCSAQPFHLLNQLMPFQYEVNVVGVMWLNYTPVDKINFCVWLHSLFLFPHPHTVLSTTKNELRKEVIKEGKKDY